MEGTLKVYIIFSIVISLLELSSGHDFVKASPEPDPLDCTGVLPTTLIQEIQSYQSVASRIIEAAVNGTYKGRVYSETARFADLHPFRLPGSAALERSIDYVLVKMEEHGFHNVQGENISTPVWTRGKESATLLTPTRKDLRMLGYGYSVGTGPEGITAEALVVKTFEELTARAREAVGKIIIFNQDYLSYGESQMYRAYGASRAAEVGGVAALVRSITPFSMDTPHTGIMRYLNGSEKVPVAAITVEDAQMLWRMGQQGDNITIQLQMEAENFEEPTTSRNAMGDLPGSSIPDEVVILSGHIDGWEVGQAVMDDAGAVFMSMEALNLLRDLELVPRRTLRALAWTCEENGLFGVQGFVATHELDKYVAAFESDTGLFKPMFLDYAGSVYGACMMSEVAKLLPAVHVRGTRKFPIVGSDISLLTERGVPGISVGTDGYETDEYFWYHHTAADTVAVLDSTELDECLAVWAVASYVIANLSVTLPRADIAAPGTTTPSLASIDCQLNVSFGVLVLIAINLHLLN